MRQFSLPEITRDIEQMAAEKTVTHQLGKLVLHHVETYMQQKNAATIRLTTACALILEAFQLYDI